MAGVPDGLGACDNGDDTFAVLVSHEIPNTAGVVRSMAAKRLASKGAVSAPLIPSPMPAATYDLLSQVCRWP